MICAVYREKLSTDTVYGQCTGFAMMKSEIVGFFSKVIGLHKKLNVIKEMNIKVFDMWYYFRK